MVDILRSQTSAALSTLASQTVLQIEAQHDSEMIASFLLKKVHVMSVLRGLTDLEGPVMIGMAQGSASVTAIKSALERILLGPDKAVQVPDMVVLWETVRMFPVQSSDEFVLDEVIKGIGGGKGIPFREDVGFQWFAYNFDTADPLSTGAIVDLSVTYWGAFLGA